MSVLYLFQLKLLKNGINLLHIAYIVFTKKKPKNWCTIIEKVFSDIILTILLFQTIGSKIWAILNQNAIPKVATINGIITFLSKSLHHDGVYVTVFPLIVIINSCIKNTIAKYIVLFNLSNFSSFLLYRIPKLKNGIKYN